MDAVLTMMVYDQHHSTHLITRIIVKGLVFC